MASPKIFVQIASYRDLELVPTIDDALAQAEDPGRLRFGVCWQYGAGEREIVHPLLDRPECRIVTVPAEQAQGMEWARGIAQELRQDEPYVLQIDSHMRFARGWDAHLIAMLADCSAEKSLLTASAPPYEPHSAERRDIVTRLVPDRFMDGGGLLLTGFGDLRRFPKPQSGLFVSGHFIFANATFWKEMPHDPGVCFLGDEMLLALRAWTRGWDVFHPHAPVLWHCYNRRAGRAAIHYNDIPNWTALNSRSEAHIRQIAGMEPADHDFGAFGLGTSRSVADLERLAGVDFQRRTLSHSLQRPIRETTGQLVRAAARQQLTSAAEDRIHCLLDQEVDWWVLSATAQREEVMALVAHHLRRLGADRVPRCVLADMKAFYLANALHRRVWASELTSILGGLEEAGIDAAAIGGPCMTQNLYDDPDWRQMGRRRMGRIDTLISANDLPNARALLLARGYEMRGDRRDDDGVHESFAGGRADVTLRAFRDPAGAALLQQRVWMVVPETKTRISELHAEALILLLSRQIARAQPARLARVIELAALLQRTPSASHASAVRLAREVGWEAELATAAAVAHRLLETPLPDAIDRLVRVHANLGLDAERIAQRPIAFEDL